MSTTPTSSVPRWAADSGAASGRLFELVTRASSAASYDWLPERDEVRFSQAAQDLFGFESGVWPARRYRDLIHRDDLSGYRAAMIACLKGRGDRSETTYRFASPNGGHRWVRDQATVERDAAGRVTWLVGVLSDITEAKQREAELQAANRALDALNADNRNLIARQAASFEVLQAISGSPEDTDPVFHLIARRARALCGAEAVGVIEYDGTLMHLRVIDGYDPAAAERMRQAFPLRPGPEGMAGRTVLAGQVVHIRDRSTDAGLSQLTRDLGSRSALGVPLVRDGRVIGAIVLSRFETGGFEDSQIALVQSFAEQAVIAIGSATALRELRDRTAELATRNSEYGERIEHQAATIDVLKAMSASPGDTQPVFDLIVRRARELCNGMAVGLFEYDGHLVHHRATSGGDNAAHARYEALFPMAPNPATVCCRAILQGQVIHIRDVDAEPGLLQLARELGGKTILSVPLLRDGVAIGSLSLNSARPGGFSDTQVALLQTFAEQAVIAIGSAETFRELQARTAELATRNSEYGERIEHQAATIDVLKAMSGSPGDAQPVFDLIVERARVLCGAELAGATLRDGDVLQMGSHSGFTDTWARAWEASYPMPVDDASTMGRAVLSGHAVEIPDALADPAYGLKQHGAYLRSMVAVPMLRGGTAIGAIGLARPMPGHFSSTQIELLQTFAEQAVIAISGADTYRELQARTAALARRNSEYGERIEQQAATIDVLKVMSSTPDDTRPVFEQIVRRATQLCGGDATALFEFDGELARLSSYFWNTPDEAAIMAYVKLFPRRPSRDFLVGQAILDKRMIHIRDYDLETGGVPEARRLGSRSRLLLPLIRDGGIIGVIALNAREPGGFTDSQVELLQTLAEQAVIAISSVANFRTLRERTAELTRSVAELQALEEVLRAVNSSLDIDTVLATVISRAVRLSDADEGTIYEFDTTEAVFVPKSAFGMSAERVEALRERRIRLGETHLGRSATLRAPVAVGDVQRDPTVPNASEVLPGIHAVLAVPLLREDTVIGGLVIRRRRQETFPSTTVTLMQTFAAQCVLAIENARLFQEAGRARSAAEAALADLRHAQDRLVQSEKLASLGQLTAGIAHEIKNPLNFVNNFSDLSADLLDELHDALAPEKVTVAANLRAEIDELTATLKGNLEKIAQHGRRADSIVKNMLLHSRAGPSERRPINLNATAEEALNLAYHGARAERPDFNITLEKKLDPQAGMVEVFPQEFIRAMLNLIGNGFYAAGKRAEQTTDPGFEPTLRLTTRDLGEQVEIRVRDNGTGISDAVRARIFEPFFTTKPAGEGTGLGLSLSYDIIVEQHAGRLTVDSQIDAFTEFVITLPRGMPVGEGSRT